MHMTQTIQQGWQCPICKRIMSPFQPCCVYCIASPATPIGGAGGNSWQTISGTKIEIGDNVAMTCQNCKGIYPSNEIHRCYTSCLDTKNGPF